MNGTFGKSAAKDVGDWTNNSELNPATNSPVTEDSVVRGGDKENAQSWREDNIGNADHGVSAGAVAAQDSETETGTDDPGRTPGKAEGVDDAEEKGNEDS
jgi:hypothetical protein